MEHTIDDNIFGVTETVKTFVCVELQKRGMEREMAQGIANLCGTWFLRGYEYRHGNTQLELF